VTALETTSIHSAEDPGLLALEIVLRLHGLEVDPEHLAGRGASIIDASDMLNYARRAGLSARYLKTDWTRLSRYRLPGVAPLRDGSFSIIGRVVDDKAVILHAGASRPVVMNQTEFTTMWDNELILIGKPTVLSVSRARLHKLLARLRQRPQLTNWRGTMKSSPNARNIVPLGSARRGAVVLSDRARKFGSAVARLVPRDRSSHAHELAFLPAALEIVETPPSPIGRAIAFSIAGMFAFALLWATFGTIDIVATAPGKFIPSGRTKSIQPLETGVVRSINVTDGQAVRAGDLLVALDSTMNAAELDHLKGDLLSSQLDVARLKAALNGTQDPLTAFTPPGDAPAALVEMHRRFLRSQTTEQAAKLAAINGQIAQKEAERTTSRALSEKLRAVMAPLQQRVEIREQMFQKGLGSKLTYLTELQDLVSQRQELSVQESRYSEADAAIAVLVETRAKAVAEYDRALFEELAKTEQKMAGLAQDVIKAQRRTALQTLTAPIDGTVQQLAIYTINGVVTPAQTLMLIVPADSKLELEAIISNRDIGFIEPGQDVTIKVDTFSFTRYGLLNGKIISISKDAITRNKPTPRNNEASPSIDASSSEPPGQELVYSARVSVDRTRMDVDDKTVDLSPGMAATVEVKTGSRSIISYLLSPLLRYKHESLRER
jgi:hemolysin D